MHKIKWWRGNLAAIPNVTHANRLLDFESLAFGLLSSHCDENQEHGSDHYCNHCHQEHRNSTPPPPPPQQQCPPKQPGQQVGSDPVRLNHDILLNKS
jgi:hypothetical protein